MHLDIVKFQKEFPSTYLNKVFLKKDKWAIFRNRIDEGTFSWFEGDKYRDFVVME